MTGWHYFPPQHMIYYPHREQLQYKLLSGDSSGMGYFIDRYGFFKDAAGKLDPNFDVPTKILERRSNWYSSSRGSVYYVDDLLSCGPVDWACGDTLKLTFGVLVAQDLEQLKTRARIAKKIVANGYRGIEGPPPPKVTAVPGDGKITLYWDSSAEEATDIITGYRDFEGYRIYRTVSDPVNKDWGEPIYDHRGKLINFLPLARCDLDNGIDGFEDVYPFQDLGDNTGLFHTWIDTSVTNGITYWYSVCAYDQGIVDNELLNPHQFPVSSSKECPKGANPATAANLVKCIPALPAADLKGSQIEVVASDQSVGNGTIEAVIIDPYAITGNDYRITFEDTTYGFAVYDLYDVTKDVTVYEKVAKTKGEEGLIFDGIKLKVLRYDNLEILNSQTYWYNYVTGGKSFCTWTIFGDKLTWDPYPFEYEIRFVDHMETGAFTGKTAPFEIWNTALDQKCQWDIYFDPKTDTTDFMKATWTSNDMIYIWDKFLETNKFTIRVHIIEFSYMSYNGRVNNPPQPGDAIHFVFQRPFRTGDQFLIKTTAFEKKSETGKFFEQVKVVPNPYIVHAGWELSSSESRIEFINLPSLCTIHIFSMSGEKVRTLFHNAQTDYQFWDLLNNSNLKVSFGLYIFVVETADGKTQKGKFAVLR